MTNRFFIAVAAAFFTVLSETGWAVDNPAVNKYVGSGRVPISNVRSGLVARPTPFDTTSNQVVYGQVAGGKHFRGVLPYNVDTDFGGRLGSTSLDSFMRYSAGTGSIGLPAGRYEPYYSPTRTVTTMRPGFPDVIRPPTPDGEFRNYGIGGFAAPTLPKTQMLPGSGVASDNISVSGMRPMAMSPEEIEKIISRETTNYLQAKKSADEQYRKRMEEFRQKLGQISKETAESQQDSVSQGESLHIKSKLEENISQQSDLPGTGEQTSGDKQHDVYEQMKQRIEGLQGNLEESAGTAQTEKAAAGAEKPAGETSGSEKPSKLETSVAAEAIRGKYQSFAAYSEDKFNQYMRVAEEYLKGGKYYRAADAYTLASIYKSNDPLAYAGKSHALFAAGEYMSSALFLSRALEIFPEYARFKIDIVAMAGDKDNLETRIKDVEQWVEKSGAGELQFLLAYVYYQMDRLDSAKDVIESAFMKMPESPAVAALKKAIDDAVKSQYKPVSEEDIKPKI